MSDNGRLSTPCIYCGDPGYLLAIARDIPTAADIVAEGTITTASTDSGLRSVAACDRHVEIVRAYGERLYQPRRMAYRDGRPTPTADPTADQS
jgi:hypothetical protein